MRCKNCGWPNRPGETVCVKCGSPLSEENSNETALENLPGAYYNNANGNINATIPESAFFGNTESVDVDEQENVCPKCGYPLRPNITLCPNCKYQLSNNNKRQPTKDNFVNSFNKPTRMENPSAKKPITGTINPYMIQAEQDPTFILSPQQRVNEKKILNNLEYEGKEVLLNRDNTEPENGSITSQVQAIVVNENGRWYIEDKSEQGTTFVRATKKIELNEGDTILLGNRLFEFHL